MTATPIQPTPPMGNMTGVAPMPVTSKFKPVDPMRVLRKHLALLIALAVLGGMLGTGAYLALRQFMPKWTSTARLEARFRDATGQIGDPRINGTATELEQFISGQIAFIESDDILSSTLDRDAVKGTSWYSQLKNDNPTPEELIEAFSDTLGVAPIRNSAMIKLALATKDKSESPEILRNLIDVYLNRLDEISAEFRGSEFQELSQAERSLEATIRQLEGELEQLSSTNRVPASIAETPQWQKRTQLIQIQAESEEYLRQAQSAFENLQKQLQEGTLQPTSGDELVVQNDLRVRNMDYEIDAIQRSLEANRAKYGSRHTITQSTENQLAAANQQRQNVFNQIMAQVLNNNVSNAQSARDSAAVQLEEIRSQIEALNAEIADVEALILRREALADQILRNRDRQADLQEKLELVRAASKKTALDSKTVVALVMPQKPLMTFPSPMFIPIGLLLGFGIPYGLLLLKDLMDQHVRSPFDLKTIPLAETLGVIPNTAEDPSGNQSMDHAVEKAPTGLIAESFRQTRTALMGKMERRGHKSLVVCGAQGGSGVSSVVYNLAVSAALNDRQVLVIDANLRRPKQHELFGTSNAVGLVNVLNESAPANEAIQSHPSLPISVLPCGPAAQAAPELLDRQAFRRLLEEVEQSYDLILIDTAPALLTSEASLLIKTADAVAAVVRADEDQRGMIDRLLNRLDGQRADLVGVVLNGVRASAGGYFKKNYENFYRYNQAAS